MRRLLVVTVILATIAVLGVAADFTAARSAESMLAARAAPAVEAATQQDLELPAPPKVHVRDRPFLLSLATGRVRTVDIEAADVRVNGTSVDRVVLRGEGTSVPRSVLLGDGGIITVEQVRGAFTFSDRAVATLLQTQLPGLVTELQDGAVQLTLPASAAGEVTALIRPVIRDGQLALEPEAVTVNGQEIDPALLAQLQGAGAAGSGASGLPGSLQLPELPEGFVPQDVTVTPDGVTISGTANDLELTTV